LSRLTVLPPVRYTSEEDSVRQAVVLLVLFTLPELALAQQSLSGPPPFSGLAPIGLPLPPIGLPLPPIGLPPSPVATPAPSPESRRSGRPGRLRWEERHRPVTSPAIVYLGSPYYWSSYEPSMETALPAAAMPTPRQPAITGVLRLEIEPHDLLQVYVDDEFVGTIEDLAGELVLERGGHRIEIRKPGYEPVTFDARIVAGRTITYRGALTPLPQAAVVPDEPTPKRPQTFYLIRGCYLGNVPPEQVRLPPGCEGRPVITYTP
jgi:hypothetical protein